MPKLKQTSFSGGINLLVDDVSLAEDQYRLGLNVRTRNNKVVPVLSPTLIETPKGKKQGGIIAGNIQVLFVSGQAFYKRIQDEDWTLIPEFQLDSEVETIYCIAVPNASLSALRKAGSDDDASVDVIIDATTQTGSPACLICQDGINQPRLIFSDGTTRVAGTYFGWSLTNREYIPIGKQMMYYQGILYIVATDGKSIYRSVSGRPLDFVVNIDKNGYKGGDATTTSFAVDYNVITCIQALNTDSFFVGTAYRCYSVKPNYNDKMFGEPTFVITFLYNTGVINNKCFTEALGDFCFIDFDGLRSFNAVSQFTNEGRNSVFSQNLDSLFTDVRQNADVACATVFNNYVYFSAKTTYGDCILVFDTLSKIFVSLDIHAASNVKQFLTSYNEYEQKLFVITTDNEFWELESSTERESAVLLTRAWITNNDADYADDTVGLHRTRFVNLQFRDNSEEGTLTITEYVDGMRSFIKELEIPTSAAGFSFPITTPLIADTEKDMHTLKIAPTNRTNLAGNKISYCIVWDSDAALGAISIETDHLDK